MTTAHIKKVTEMGGSLAIIPLKQWVKRKVRFGEEMIVVGNGELRIFPVHSRDGQVQEG